MIPKEKVLEHVRTELETALMSMNEPELTLMLKNAQAALEPLKKLHDDIDQIPLRPGSPAHRMMFRVNFDLQRMIDDLNGLNSLAAQSFAKAGVVKALAKFYMKRWQPDEPGEGGQNE
jgi:hypothetical protein